MEGHQARGLVPLSADPMTYGHIDLITRASTQCRELIVLIALNDGKCGSYVLPLCERVLMARRALRAIKNVRVIESEGLLVDVFLREGCDVVFRGIRNEADKTYEETQMRYHDLILPGFSQRVVYLPARQELRDISSSLVKAFVSHGVDVSPFVPLFVKARLEELIVGQFLIGVSGGMASGKSYVAAQLAQHLGGTHVNFDEFLRELYVEDSPGAQLVRDRLAELLGRDVLSPDGKSVERQTLKVRIFDPHCPNDVRRAVHDLTTPHVLRLYRKYLKGVRGVVLVEWAQLVEMGLANLVNNRVIVVDSPDRDELLKKRGIDRDAFDRVAAHQWSVEQKVSTLESVVARDQFGSVVAYENSLDPERSARGIEHLATHVREILHLKERS